MFIKKVEGARVMFSVLGFRGSEVLFLVTCSKARIWSFKIGLGTAPTRAVLTSRLESIKAKWGMPSTRNLLTMSAVKINQKKRNNRIAGKILLM